MELTLPDYRSLSPQEAEMQASLELEKKLNDPCCSQCADQIQGIAERIREEFVELNATPCCD